MKNVICIEGADGSGKSTLAKAIIAESERRGLSSRVIGRRIADAGQYIAAITDFCQSLAAEQPKESVRADLHLRLAREYLRAEECRRSSDDLIILDRFIISVLSRMRVDGGGARTFLPHLKDIVATSGLTAVIYCSCSFNTAWKRVANDVGSGARAGLSPKEQRGRAYLKKLHETMEHDFKTLRWLPRRCAIKTDKGIETMQRQIEALFTRKIIN